LVCKIHFCFGFFLREIRKIVRLTGGSVVYFPGFPEDALMEEEEEVAVEDGEIIHMDITKHLSPWEADEP
jgi:hypothetical protein